MMLMRTSVPQSNDRRGVLRAAADLTTSDRRFGHAIRLEHRRAERGLEIVHDLWRQRGAAGANESEFGGAGGPGRARLHARQQQLVQRRDAEYHVAPCSCAVRQNDNGLNSRGRPRCRRWRASRASTPPVRARETTASRTTRRRPASALGARHVAGRNREIRVAERHPFRPPGTAARVEDQRDVIHVGRVGLAIARDVTQAHDAGGIHRTVRIGTASPPRGALGRPVGRQQEDFRVRVLEEKLEFIFPVAGLSGAAVPAIEAARNETIAGRPFGNAMPTRSPWPIPAAAS